MNAHTPCMFCEWCLFNLKWHGQAYESLCVKARAAIAAATGGKA